MAGKDLRGSLKGTLSVTAAPGSMGGAQPMDISMNGGVCLAAEVEKWRMEKEFR